MIFQHGQLSITTDPRSPNPRQDRIYVHYKKRIIKIMTSDIRYVEAHRAYCRLVTIDGREFTLSLALGVLQKQLPTKNIIRVHRSYLVNILHIDQIEDNTILSGKKILPLSRSCRASLLALIRIIGK